MKARVTYAASGTPAEVIAQLSDVPVGKLEETKTVPGSYTCSILVRGVFRTSREAFAAAEAYERNWPSMGYGTHLTVSAHPLGHEVKGRRMQSCD